MLQTLLRTRGLCPMPLLVHKIIRVRMNEIPCKKHTPSKANHSAQITAHALGSSFRMVVYFKEESLLMLKVGTSLNSKEFYMYL